jgi:hypothetical protein
MKVDLDIGTGMRRRPLLRMLDGTAVASHIHAIHASRRAAEGTGSVQPPLCAKVALPLALRSPSRIGNTVLSRLGEPTLESTSSTSAVPPGK